MRINRWTRSIAVAAATALTAGVAFLAPATAAQAATSVALSGPGSTVAAARNLPVTFTINGDATNWRADISAISSRVSASYRRNPGNLVYTGLPSIGRPFAAAVPIASNTTPGRYRLTISAIENGAVTSSAHTDFTVLASTSYSRANTSTGISGVVGKNRRITFKVFAPNYQVGASAKVYYKFKGTKKFVKVASGRLNSTGYARMLTKKGKIRKAGRYYVKIGGVTYAGGYNTKTVKTYIRSI